MKKILFAQHSLEKSLYALKIISLFDGSDKISTKFLEIARNEADFLKSQNHPNIISYVDSFQIDFYYIIVVEKYEKNLEQLVGELNNSQSQISSDLYFNLASQTLSAIDFLHKKQYKLEQLSLKTILIDRNNEDKLYNFKQQKQENVINSQYNLNTKNKDNQLKFNLKMIDQPPSIEKKRLFCLNSLKNVLSQIQESSQKQQISQLIDLLENCVKKNLVYDYFENQQQKMSKIDEQLSALQKQIQIFHAQMVCVFEIPFKFTVLIDLGRKYFIFGNLNTSLKCFFTCLGLYQELKTQIQYLKDNGSQIQPKYQEIEERMKIDHLMYTIGKLFYFKKQQNNAIKLFKKSLKLNRYNEKCYHYLAILYRNQGMMEEAIESSQQALQLYPNSYANLIQKGFTLSQKGILDKAIKYYRMCLKLNPKIQICYIYLAKAFYDKGLLDEAIKFYKKGLKLNRNTGYKEQFYYNLGVTFPEKGEIDIVLKIFLLHIKPSLKNANFYNNLGNIYLQQSDFLNAIKQYQLSQIINQNIKFANQT
ncbi:hypothetical protein ABPG72_008242 [Tetrahymena utriculariae]